MDDTSPAVPEGPSDRVSGDRSVPLTADGPSAPRSTAEQSVATHPGPPSKIVRNLVIGALVVLVLFGYTAAGLFSYLLSEHPLVFIGLSSSNRNLALASADLSTWAFYSVAFLRLLAPDPLFFLLGRWYGDAATRWMERKSPSYGQLLRQLERWFARARYPVVMFAPNNPVCLFAGASTMTWGSFLVANVVGTVARLILIRTFSSVFEDLLGPIRGFISDYQKPLLVITVALVALSIWSERRAGRDKIGDLVNLSDDLDNERTGDGGTDEATGSGAESLDER